SISMNIYKKPDRLITVSEKMRQYFIEKLGRPEDNVTFVPQSPEKLYEERKSSEALRARFEGGFHIVFTGNISPAQNFDMVTDAAQLLKKEGYTDIKFIIVGDGMSFNDLKESVEKKELQELFFFEGFRPIGEMPEYADIADALIATLKSEGVEDYSIPAKVMSYMASGKPLLIAMEGEINDIIHRAECGLTSDPDDASQLAENIKTLYHMDQAARDQMGKNAYLYQQEHFERDKSIDKILEVITGGQQ
ncbi:MAG: glycosyltransferase family 4 protein, partial [Lachnospiraceae bacterium]|nr:glycosyltransferase family 4 protein [Lachnospiraceae bacterium]